MSAQEIIVALSGLSRPDLQQVDLRLHELLRGNGGGDGPARSWGNALLELAGTAPNLPADFARNHDHYLHGTPKR